MPAARAAPAARPPLAPTRSATRRRFARCCSCSARDLQDSWEAGRLPAATLLPSRGHSLAAPALAPAPSSSSSSLNQVVSWSGSKISSSLSSSYNTHGSLKAASTGVPCQAGGQVGRPAGGKAGRRPPLGQEQLSMRAGHRRHSDMCFTDKLPSTEYTCNCMQGSPAVECTSMTCSPPISAQHTGNNSTSQLLTRCAARA